MMKLHKLLITSTVALAFGATSALAGGGKPSTNNTAVAGAIAGAQAQAGAHAGAHAGATGGSVGDIISLGAAAPGAALGVDSTVIGPLGWSRTNGCFKAMALSSHLAEVNDQRLTTESMIRACGYTVGGAEVTRPMVEPDDYAGGKAKAERVITPRSPAQAKAFAASLPNLGSDWDTLSQPQRRAFVECEARMGRRLADGCMAQFVAGS